MDAVQMDCPGRGWVDSLKKQKPRIFACKPVFHEGRWMCFSRIGLAWKFSNSLRVRKQKSLTLASNDQNSILNTFIRRLVACDTNVKCSSGVGDRRIKPSEFPEHRFGKLRFVYRSNGPSLLVVKNVQASYSRKTGE